MSDSSPAIYTIGHRNHTWEGFLALLRPYRLDLLIDVRSYPRSRFAPWSNRVRLQRQLARCGIDYLWKGDSLGGVPRGPKSLETVDDMSVDEWYQNRRSETDFLTAIADVSLAAAGKRLVLMCSEGDPARCHRALLLEPALRTHDVDIRHIDPKTGEIRLRFDLVQHDARHELDRTPPSP